MLSSFGFLGASAAPVLEAPGLRVHYQERDEARARQAVALFRDVAADIETRLGLAPPAPLDVYLSENDAAFERVVGELAAGARPPGWALAVAIPGGSGGPAVVVRASRLEVLSWNDLRPTLAHELAHLALARAGRIPRWLNEGLALYAEGRRTAPEEQTRLQRHARAGDLPELADLARDFPAHAEEAQLSYLESLALVESLEAAAGAPAIRDFLRRLEGGEPFDRAFERAFEAPLRGYEIVWRADLARRYSLARDVWERASILTFAALLAIPVFVRYLWRRRKLLRAMDEAETPPPPADPPG